MTNAKEMQENDVAGLLPGNVADLRKRKAAGEAGPQAVPTAAAPTNGLPVPA